MKMLHSALISFVYFVSTAHCTTWAQKNAQNKAAKYHSASEKFFSNYENVTGKTLPVDNRISIIYSDRPKDLVSAMEETHVSMHVDVYELLRKYCSATGKNLNNYIKRLISDRPLAFLGSIDKTLLRIDDKGEVIEGPTDNHGWRVHKQPEYLSYMEMLFASLLQVSSPTAFINDCNRYNNGMGTSREDHINNGYTTAVVGPRFEHYDLMESIFMLVTPESHPGFFQNPIAKLFYDYYFATDMWLNYDQIEALPSQARDARYIKTSKGYLDKMAYGKRMRLSIIPYILDANEIASKMQKSAYLYVTGWGLGYWATGSEQAELFICEFFNALNDLDHANLLTNISDVNFGWITNNSFPDLERAYKLQKTKFARSVNFLNCENNPASLENFDPKLEPNKLLFFSFAWDGNAYPGNEYWLGMFVNSGDPAAACCTTIPEVQNPQINPDFLDRVHVFPGKIIRNKRQFCASSLPPSIASGLQSTTNVQPSRFDHKSPLKLAEPITSVEALGSTVSSRFSNQQQSTSSRFKPQNSQHIAPQHSTGLSDNKSRFDENSRFKPSSNLGNPKLTNPSQIASTVDGKSLGLGEMLDATSSRFGGDVGMVKVDKNPAAQKNPPQPVRPRFGGSISGPNPASKAHPVASRLDAKPLNQSQVGPRDSSILKQPTRPLMSRFDKNVGSSSKIPKIPSAVDKRLGEYYPNATSFIETPPSNSKAINFKLIDYNTLQSAN